MKFLRDFSVFSISRADGGTPFDFAQDKLLVPLKTTKPAAIPSFFQNFKSRWRDSNPRPADYKSAALAS